MSYHYVSENMKTIIEVVNPNRSQIIESPLPLQTFLHSKFIMGPILSKQLFFKLGRGKCLCCLQNIIILINIFKILYIYQPIHFLSKSLLIAFVPTCGQLSYHEFSIQNYFQKLPILSFVSKDGIIILQHLCIGMRPIPI